MKTINPVLVVEDIPEAVEGLERLLDVEAIPYKQVKTSDDAENMLRTNPFSLMLLDLYLKVSDETSRTLSGVSIMEQLRSGKLGPLNKDIPVLVVTAYPELEIEDKFAELGASAFFAKPCPTIDIFKKIRATIDVNQ